MIDIKTVNERIENLDKKTSSNINLIIKEYKKLKEEVSYDEFLENSKGTDPDFPMIDFGDKGQKVHGINKVQAENLLNFEE